MISVKELPRGDLIPWVSSFVGEDGKIGRLYG